MRLPGCRSRTGAPDKADWVMKLKGPRVTIRPTREADLNAMARWRPFADPIYQPFDFPHESLDRNTRWFRWRLTDPARRLYTVENEHRQVIGSLTLRDINGNHSARLGITLGADFVSQGYGAESLGLFLDHFFQGMGFREMVLDVAATNLRAVRMYRSLGFRQVGQHYRPASHPSYQVLRQDEHYRHLRQFFQQQGTMVRVLFLDMVLKREEWLARGREATGP